MLFNLHKKKAEDEQYKKYAGFFPRIVAGLLDSLLISLIFTPILDFLARYLFDVNPEKARADMENITQTANPKTVEEAGSLFFEYYKIAETHGIIAQIGFVYFFYGVICAVITINFWRYYSATPAKMLFRMIIVDKKTMEKPTIRQWVLRFIGYIISAIPLGFGFVWIGMNKKRLGWHDLIAGTAVVYKNRLPNQEAEQIEHTPEQNLEE